LDVLAVGMVRAEGAYFEVVLTVHDELVTEAPENDCSFSPGILSNILAIGDTWTVGLPLAAKGFSSYRYKKED
jgi:DNA polymerase